MRVLNMLHSGQKSFLVLHNILSLMAVNIHAFFVADWFEAELMKPANGGTERYCRRKIRREVVAREQVIVNMLTEHC